jgi:branched-chain amino acid transport system substrate-binding protein
VRKTIRVAAVVAASAMAITSTAGVASAATKAKALKCPKGISIGFMGALSGENGALGQNMVDGASIAFDEWNKANKTCQVKFDKSTFKDTQGSPDQASPLAPTLVSNKNILGLIGPGFSGETKAVMPVFEAAGFPMITPGATNAKLSENGWKNFQRILANDDKQGPGIVKLMKKTAKKVGVIDDGTEYGKGLADTVRGGLGALKVSDDQINPKESDYSAAVNKMKAAGVDTVFYGGYYAEAAKLIKQMADAGVKVQFVAGDGVLDQKFIDNAGASAEGALVTATGAPADVNPAFQAKFKAKFGKDPAIYSPEAYDCASVFLAAIKSGKTTRKAIGAFIDAYDAPGITKQIKFTPEGEVAGDAVYAYQVTGGKLVPKGII